MPVATQLICCTYPFIDAPRARDWNDVIIHDNDCAMAGSLEHIGEGVDVGLVVLAPSGLVHGQDVHPHARAATVAVRQVRTNGL